MTSPYLDLPLRSEAVVRRQRKLEADLRAEGISEARIAELATPETAANMAEYEFGIVAMFSEGFK